MSPHQAIPSDVYRRRTKRKEISLPICTLVGGRGSRKEKRTSRKLGQEGRKEGRISKRIGEEEEFRGVAEGTSEGNFRPRSLSRIESSTDRASRYTDRRFSRRNTRRKATKEKPRSGDAGKVKRRRNHESRSVPLSRRERCRPS